MVLRGCLLWGCLLTLQVAAQVSLSSSVVDLPSSGTDSCDQEITTPCVPHIIPYDEYGSVFPIIEYCSNENLGFIPVRKSVCMDEGLGNWTARPDYRDKGDVEELYICSVCMALAEAKSSNNFEIWLLRLITDTTYNADIFKMWEALIGSPIREVVVAGDKRYIFFMTTYSSLQTLLDSRKHRAFIETWQPVPPELKVSPYIIELQGRNQTRSSVEIRVRTMVAEYFNVARRTERHLEIQQAFSDILNSPQGLSWAPQGAVLELETDVVGTFTVKNIDPHLAFSAAANLSTVTSEIFFIDVKQQVKPGNRDACYMTQSGAIQSAGGVTPLWQAGLSGQGAVLGIADTGLDYYSCFFYDTQNPVIFTSSYNQVLGRFIPIFDSTNHRKIRLYVGYGDKTEGTTGGHGTHVCGSAAGFPANSPTTSTAYLYKGMAYNAKIAFFDIGNSGSSDLQIPSDLSVQLFPFAYNVGARIHTNSWGAPYNGPNDLNSQIDAFCYNNQDFLVLFSAGNDGSNGARSVGIPGVTKNVLTVGATSNAANPATLAYFSSRGPTYDGRYKPDIVAPGYYVNSAYSYATGISQTCSLVTKAGTSMATPMVAGTATMVYEYFTKGYYPLGYAMSSKAFSPMGALIKAVIINSARPLTDTEATLQGKAIPSYDQGFGMLVANQTLYFEGSSNRYLFVDGKWSSGCSTCPWFAATGQTKYYTFMPTQSIPFRATLVWHDYPVSSVVTNGALINNLDLRASHAGTIYYANGRTTDDVLNNVEMVVIPTPTPGKPITVTVTATNIAMGPQPYALVVSGLFDKTSTLYPGSVPVITSATKGAGMTVGLSGTNLPLSTGAFRSVVTTCMSNNTALTATVSSFSTDGTSLGITLSGSCSLFNVYVNSSGFISDSFQVNLLNAVSVGPTKAPTMMPTKAPTIAPTPQPTASGWWTNLQSGSVGPRGDSFYNVMVVTDNTDDWIGLIPLAFPFSLFGNQYTGVYVSSNGYLAFGGSGISTSSIDTYYGFGPDQPAVPALHLVSADNSAQRIGYKTDGATYTWIRLEGTSSISGSVGSPNIVYEVLFTVDGFIEVRLGPQMRGVFVQGLSDGKNWAIRDFGIQQTSSPYSFVLKGLNYVLTAVVRQNQHLNDPFSVSLSGAVSAPSQVPTASPTTPTTRAPTKKPTKAPTKAPTSSPTKAPTSAPTIDPSSQIWASTLVTGSSGPRGWNYVTKPVVSTSTDDFSFNIPLPFSLNVLGQSYTDFYVSTNGYVTFGLDSKEFSNLGPTNPKCRTIHIASADNSAQQIGYQTDGATYIWVRYEGTAGSSGIVGSPNIVYEMLITSTGYIEIRLGPQMQTGVVHGLSNGNIWVLSSLGVVTSSSPYSFVLTGIDSPATAAVTKNSHLNDPFSTSLNTKIAPSIPTDSPTKVPTTSPTEQPTRSPTLLPTLTPTTAPTKLPTTSPTTTPTTTPTTPPTKTPTTSPTSPPTEVPTTAPTSAPSTSPTMTPTSSPTSPTKVPSKAPTAKPTKRPTGKPTARPTKSPTAKPTKMPTRLPTSMVISAVKASSTTPASSPTKRPTRAPTKPARILDLMARMKADQHPTTDKGEDQEEVGPQE